MKVAQFPVGGALRPATSFALLIAYTRIRESLIGPKLTLGRGSFRSCYVNPWERNMSERNQNHGSMALYIGVGVALGTGLGSSFGAVFGNVAMGVALGPAIGIAFALALWSIRSGNGTE